MMCPIHLNLRCCTVSKMLLFSCTFCTTSAFDTLSTQLIFSILLLAGVTLASKHIQHGPEKTKCYVEKGARWHVMVQALQLISCNCGCVVAVMTELAIVFWCGCFDLFFLFFRHLLRGYSVDCHQNVPRFIKFRRKFGSTPWKIGAAQKCRGFSVISGDCTIWSQISPECNKHLTSYGKVLQTAISPADAYLIWWTLVYKWWKIGLEFQLT